MKNLRFPDPAALDDTVRMLFHLLFPNNHPSARALPRSSLSRSGSRLAELMHGLVDQPEPLSERFIQGLGLVKKTLVGDARFILESDPAATGIAEVIAIYPGFYAIFCYRIAHLLAGTGVPILPRMITEHAHRWTGVDIHPGAIIGSPFSIDHATGIVIGETTRIGSRVKMYQGVTLGALSVDKKSASVKRHPTIEDGVILYAGCTILGGETVIGKNSVIGGNVWLTESVGPGTVVYHKSEIIIKNQKP